MDKDKTKFRQRRLLKLGIGTITHAEDGRAISRKEDAKITHPGFSRRGLAADVDGNIGNDDGINAASGS